MFLIKITKYILFTSIFCTLVSASNKEDFFSPNQLDGEILNLKLNKRLEPQQKAEELAKFFWEPFETKIMSVLNKEKIFEEYIKSFVKKVVLNKSKLKKQEDVQFPFIENEDLKKDLKSIFSYHFRESKDPTINKFKEAMNYAQSQLTENWLKEYSEKVNLQEMLISEYVSYYLKNYGKEQYNYNTDTSIHTGCDGYLFREALNDLNKTSSILWNDRPFFPFIIDLELDADKLLNDLGKSVYASGGDNAVLKKADMEKLENKKEEINRILSTIKTTGYPPKEAGIILTKWTRSSSGGDNWIGNKLCIAEYVLSTLEKQK